MDKEKIRIGIDVGGTNIEVCAVSVKATDRKEIIYTHRAYPKGSNTDELCAVLCECIYELLDKKQLGECDIESVGIAAPGSLDITNGIIIHAYNLNLHDAQIIAGMKKIMPSIKAELINDADAATLGEYKFGALRGISSGCLITLGTGVGAGIIINSELYRGGMRRGTELGHMTLNLNGEKCSCGNTGCIETLCSASALAKSGQIAYNDGSVTAKQITELVKCGDEKAMDIFDKYINALSAAIASYMALLDPERVVIGGGVSLAGSTLFEPLRRKTAEKSFFSPICDILPAELGDKAGVIGAAFA